MLSPLGALCILTHFVRRINYETTLERFSRQAMVADPLARHTGPEGVTSGPDGLSPSGVNFSAMYYFVLDSSTGIR